MSETAVETQGETGVEALLRRELAQGDDALAGVAPVLGHLLSSASHSLVNDDILARLRGMLGSLGQQLHRAELAILKKSSNDEGALDRVSELSAVLAESSIILSHCYAVATESMVAEDLEHRAGIDFVLPPLMQELIASSDEATAEVAMTTMAAQARMQQAQRRMSISLAELPAELFHELVNAWSRSTKHIDAASRSQVEALLRAEHDESGSRLGLLSRLVSSLNAGIEAALKIEHAGLALFTSALASVTRQPRELVVLSCQSGQLARLALSLRAAGLKQEDIAQQFLLIQPDFTLPEGFAGIGKDQARSLLDGAVSGVGRKS